jgi:hypothetical protein
LASEVVSLTSSLRSDSDSATACTGSVGFGQFQVASAVPSARNVWPVARSSSRAMPTISPAQASASFWFSPPFSRYTPEMRRLPRLLLSDSRPLHSRARLSLPVCG